MSRHSRSICLLTVFVAAFAATQAGPSAQSAKLLDKETFMEMESVGAPAISPDGKHIVFARTWIDKMKDQSRSNLWIVDADGARVRELTRGDWRDSAPVWAPDAKRIAFLSDRDGTNQLHVMYLDTGEVAQRTPERHNLAVEPKQAFEHGARIRVTGIRHWRAGESSACESGRLGMASTSRWV